MSIFNPTMNLSQKKSLIFFFKDLNLVSCILVNSKKIKQNKLKKGIFTKHAILSAEIVVTENR